jgi:hypothetical protein
LESNDTNFGMTLLAGSSANSANIFFGNESDSDIGYIQYKHTDDSVRFGVNAAERMRINSSGNVIIGATSAGNAKVTSVDGVAFEARDSTQPFYQWYNSGAGANLKYWRCGPNTSGDLQWQTVNDAYSSATVRMVIDDTGKVGIGTSGPSYILDVANNSAETARVRFRSTVSGQTAAVRIQCADTTSNTSVEFGDSGDGDVGRIIYGHNSNIMRFYVSADEKMRLESDGDLQVEGSVVGSSSVVSDERFKDDVTTITGALDTVDSLRGVTFTWNAGKNTGDTDYGFIAQEVEQVIPEIVHDKKLPLFSGNEDTVYKTIDYVKVCAVLVEAVSELRAEVQSLETRLSALEAN